MTTRKISAIAIEGIDKRLKPTKHYIYILRVESDDGTCCKIYRRYKEFLRLQIKLCSMFPKESGAVDKGDRIIPFIPGKAANGTNHLRRTAVERISHLEEFCQALMQLPDHISQSRLVTEFFAKNTRDDQISSDQNSSEANENFTWKPVIQRRPTAKASSPMMFNVIEDFSPEENARTHVPLRNGEIVEVLEKSNTGWWFVEAEGGQGWAPSSCLEDSNDDTKLYSCPGQLGKPYVVDVSYRAKESDELTIERGKIVIVMEKKSDGWWWAQYQGAVGYVPGSFLVRKETARGIRLVSDNHNQTTEDNEVYGNTPKPAEDQQPTASNPVTPVSKENRLNVPTSGPKSPDRWKKETVKTEVKEDGDPGGSSDEGSAPPGGVPERPPPRILINRDKPMPLPKREKPKVEKKSFRARQNYTPTILGTVELRKGQKVQVLPKPEVDGWTEVKVGGRRGFVPSECIEDDNQETEATENHDSNEVDLEDCYWSEDAMEGESVLRSISQPGAFMVRNARRTENEKTLLVCTENRLLKFKIQRAQDGGLALTKNSPSFPSLEDLVSHYYKHDLPTTQIKLVFPYKHLVGTC